MDRLLEAKVVLITGGGRGLGGQRPFCVPKRVQRWW